MKSVNETCENVQLELSTALDERRPASAEATLHAGTCAECGHFLRVWQGGLAEELARPLPPADLTLRSTVLALPGAATPLPQPVRHWPRVQRVLSAAAAVLVLGFFARTLIDVRPGNTEPHHPDEAGRGELAALQTDLRQGLAALRAPTAALQHVLGQ